MTDNRTNSARVLRLTNAIIDDDKQIARLVIDEAHEDGRIVPLVLGALVMASSIIEAALATDRERVRAYLDQITAAHLDEDVGEVG
ncbi:MAG: hypothetical protein U1C73_12935 [Dietzia sp.]|nr:hypothetical protein [Dietzia sp.]